jgi:HPr kinase/phosphorylase
MNHLTVSQLLLQNRETCQLTALADPGVAGDRPLFGPGIGRPGLALAGFWDKFEEQSLQLLGPAEAAYLKQLPADGLTEVCGRLFAPPVPGCVVSDNARVPDTMIELAHSAHLPLLASKLPAEQLAGRLSRALDRHFAARTLVHGSFVDVYGVGILLTGPSGIGKSEIALDLLERGHRLVGDDMITLQRRANGELAGIGNELLKHHMELRGIGIVDIRSLFGLKAVRQEKRLEVEVRLERWHRSKNFERLGLDTVVTAYLGVEIPLVTLPIFPGKNVAAILEVVALNYLMYQNYGYKPAEKLNERLIKYMAEKSPHQTAAQQ